MLAARRALEGARDAATTVAAAARGHAARAAPRPRGSRPSRCSRGAARPALRAPRALAHATIVNFLRELLLLRREVKTLSATLLQSVWRGVACRVSLLARASASAKIGATWRAVVSTRKFGASRAASRAGQRSARLFLARRRMASMRAAVVRVQGAARSHSARRALAALKAEAATRAAAATKLQCRTRVRLAVTHAANLRQLVHLANIAMLHSTARFVQTYVRFRQALKKRIAAANRIGGTARTIAAVQRHCRIKHAVRRLQARARARKLRSRIYAKRPELRAIAERCAKAREAAIAPEAMTL